MANNIAMWLPINKVLTNIPSANIIKKPRFEGKINMQSNVKAVQPNEVVTAIFVTPENVEINSLNFVS